MIIRATRASLIAALAISATACSSGGGLDASSSAVAVTSSLPPPDTTTSSVDFTNYRIGPRDQLSIEVFGAPELKRESEVDASGNLSLPLIGTVAAGGRTPREVSDQIASQLRGRYIRDPQVTVNIVKANPQTVTVDGAVREPGIYPITGRMTLQQAVASAKGADDLANLNSVVIFRTVNNRRMAALFSLREIRAGRMQDPAVYGNDVVVVGENATRRFFRDLSIFPRLGSFVPFF